MKQVTIFTLLVMMFAPAVHVKAQDQTHKLTAEELENFREQAIDRLQDLLSILGSKDKTIEEKATYKKQTMELFIGDGKPFTDVDGYEHRAVYVQVSKLSGPPRPRSLPLSMYLDNLIKIGSNAKVDAKVQITQAEIWQLSTPKQVQDHYETTAILLQTFCGYGADGRKRFCDAPAAKTISFSLYLNPDEDYFGKKWIIKFGYVDISE